MFNLFKDPEEIMHASIRDNDIPTLRRQIEQPNAREMIDYEYSEFGTPLHVAIWCDNLPAVQILLAAGANILRQTSDSDGLTCLALAAGIGRRDIFHHLWHSITHETRAKGPRLYSSCLAIAAQHGQTALVSDLLVLGDGCTDAMKNDVLFWAVGRWQVHVVDLLLAKITFTPEILLQALHQAAESKIWMDNERASAMCSGADSTNQGLLIARLIDAGADPNARLHGRLALFKAATAVTLSGGLAMLLEKGSDPNAVNVEQDGKTALHRLSYPIQTHAHTPKCCIHETGIRLLLQYGACVLHRDSAGNTPLHQAAFGTNDHIIQLYLSMYPSEKHESMLNVQNDHGETLLHWAAAGGKTDIIRYLVFRGANVNAASANGWTPLLCAVTQTREHNLAGFRVKRFWEAVQTARLLLFHGANPRVSTSEGWTLLHCLARYSDADEDGDLVGLANCLIEKCVDIEAHATLILEQRGTSVSNEAPFNDFAWGYQVTDMIELAESSALIQLRPGLTPLHWASRHGAVGLVKVLLAHGANVAAETPSGVTPMRMAVEREHGPIHTTSLQQKSQKRLVELLESVGGKL